MTTGGLVVRGLVKSYGATRALSGVDLRIMPGQVVALVGHNGAGKSTLLRALSGAEVPDVGTISIDGAAQHFQSPADASAAGIACVYQELSLIDELTVAENLFLGAELFAGPLLDRRRMNRRADEICAEFKIAARAGVLVGRLPVSQRQLLEVARAIHRDAKFLLLDEPTTALERQQVEELLATIRRLARERGIGILFIDHKLDEVFAVANRVVGLANGRIVLDGEAGDVRMEDVVEAIVGAGAESHAVPARHDARAPHAAAQGDVVFAATGLAGGGLGPIDLAVRGGEILGIYGLNGSGRSRFLRTVYGAEPASGGTMRLQGKAFSPGDPSGAVAEGVAFLSEERKSDGFVPQMSSVENIVLPVLGRFMRLRLLNWRALRRAAADVLTGIPVRGDVAQPIVALSGGNQQKVLFARALLQAPRLLLLDEPTKGVDIGAKADIYAIVRNFARQGRAVLVVSSEEEELLELAESIVVFRNGACDGVAVPAADLTVADLRRHAWASADTGAEARH